MINGDILLFFDRHPAALPLYEALAQAVAAQTPDVRVKVQKTQIGFYNRHLFACVSFLPVRRAAQRPRDFITVSFGLDAQKRSPRIDAAVQVSPRRWTHHVLVASAEEIDPELLAWIQEASALAAGKR